LAQKLDIRPRLDTVDELARDHDVADVFQHPVIDTVTNAGVSEKQTRLCRDR
jgi:hypothetical protein